MSCFILILSSISSVHAQQITEDVDLTNVPLIEQQTPSFIPEVSPTPKPDAGATWEYTKDPEYGYYSLEVDWIHVPGSSGYSVSLSKVPGADPGNTITTKRSSRHYKQVSPGKWFLNLKTQKQNRWSKPIFWEIYLPMEGEISEDIEEGTDATEFLISNDGESIRFRPPATPTPSQKIDEVLGTSESIEADTSQDSRIKAIRSQIEAILQRLSFQEYPEDEPIPTPEPTPVSIYATSESADGFTCDCSKACRELSSCAEAYFQLYRCGCVNLDPNADQIPCSRICHPGRENSPVVR
ncbi:MAG: hypothetical protein ACOCXQ_04965 [Patescibacteria group bacterium]